MVRGLSLCNLSVTQMPSRVCVCVPLGELRMYVEQGEVSMSREAEVSTRVVTE